MSLRPASAAEQDPAAKHKTTTTTKPKPNSGHVSEMVSMTVLLLLLLVSSPFCPLGLCVPHPKAGIPQGWAPGSLPEQCESTALALHAPLSPRLPH
jgi:hypothetical protein